MEGGSVSPMLHLNLYNFDTLEAEGSRYILTSPRSLEACARHDIKPIELLHKPLSELADEHPDTPVRIVSEFYEIYEKKRRRNLRKCREERDKIIEEEKNRRTPILSFASFPVQKKLNPSEQDLLMKSQFGDELHYRDHLTVNDSRSTSKEEMNETTSVGKTRPSIDLTQESCRKDFIKNSSLAELVGKSVASSLGDFSNSPFMEKTVNKIAKKVEREAQVTIPEKDRKIAALMLAKHEEEKLRQEQKLKADHLWAELKRRDELFKLKAEKKKRWNQCKNVERWQRELKMRKSKIQMEEKVLADHRSRDLTLNEEKWKRLAEEQENRRKENLKREKYEAEIKKLQKEQQLKEKEAINQAAKEQLNQTLHEKILWATQGKTLKEMKERRKIQMNNKQEKLKHLTLKKEVDNQSKAEELMKRLTTEQRFLKSQEKYYLIIEERDKKLKEKAAKEDQQLLTARNRAERYNQGQMQHKNALIYITDRKIKQANNAQVQNVLEKVERIKKLNAEKEKTHHLMKQKVEEETEWHRQGIQEIIREKDKKSEQILKEKEATIEESRKTARASFQMREKIRDHINNRSFDQMALDAQLIASFHAK
ncbi:coiled-coil domain-containing protein 177 [Latimeria chalumnae]|uniref:Coiled-coil domain containing 185 n=1 Tax=Latimeria chalumnae TaxID=7897 RepID=H3A7W5_LATCH|nr:PREDICTED: coiled-coil domain-containing protein 185 [Latimeria chalumnae]|eukprot:XP_006012811.1 PREDICTED: coiled-coil domain-containing protein 185 [Latimeria chalumnae]